MRKRDILAIITARGGSKGIPKKNIALLNGKPLIAWTIEAAKCSKYITRIVVSSEDDEILEVATQYKAETLRRPKRLATDTATSESVVAHVLESLEKEEGYTPAILVLLQPTSPLRTPKDIDNTIERLTEKGTELCLSVYEAEKEVLKAYVLKKNKYLEGAVCEDYPYIPRQKLPNAYFPNGAIYAMKTNVFRRIGSFKSNKAVPYIMDKERSVDINEPDDLKLAARLLKKKK